MDQKINTISNDRQLPGQVLSSGGGKDDAGKTNVATNIAITLTNRNRPSISMDADSRLANIDFWLLESTFGGRVEFFSKRLAGADARSVS
jgi:Mrp family chromosome partitioning ATPase